MGKKLFKLPYLDFKLPDTREVLWKKVRLSLKWVNENELSNYDYILRADDDSYFIMENLRFFLLPFNPNKALYFGARFKENLTSGYMSGGAGYILSREAVKQIATSLDDPNICSQPTDKNYHDDYEIGVCVKNLNITSVDTRDNLGRHRMLPWSPAAHFITGLEERHFKWLYYPYNQTTTFECCAEHMISFHYVYKEMLYILEFLTYNAHLIGSMDKLRQKINKKNANVDLIERLKLASAAISMSTDFKN
uniref:N-acetylgalactosaminide beta-1,3-galactosyltransferase n=1 Tax=Panagrolaimus davidi TaxID=227884 RepID=A0A914QFU4_9BILA